jgi:tRNA(Ile2) C34 agmatinyltransferase TiaS
MNEQQGRLIIERLDRIVALLEAMSGEEPGAQCPRCGGETEASGTFCAECKVVMTEEVPT